jgi:ABC-2 type transport system permease protein
MFMSNFIPLMVVMGFAILLMSSSGFLVQALVEEKENRTMEIVITSVSPGQLMAGKVLGIVGLAITQLVAWLLVAALALVAARALLGFEMAIAVPPGLILMVIAVGLPVFVMFSGILVAIGSTMVDPQEAQQITGMAALPIFAPLWLGAALIEHPDGPLALILSLFPPTSLSALGLRYIAAPIPGWQLAVSSALAALGAAGALWLAGRALRLSLLRYGKKFALRDLLPARSPR